MQTIDVSPTLKVDYYDSLYETICAAREGAPKKRQSVVKRRPYELSEACDKALHGDAAMLSRINQRVESINAQLPSLVASFSPRVSLSTGQLNAGRYAIGHPAMFTRRVRTDRAPREGHGKIVRIVYNYAISPSIGHGDRWDTGAAVVSLIQHLENAGNAVELVMVNGNVSYRTYTTTAEHHIVTVAKRSDSVLSLETIAYLLCERDMDYQIAFSLMDRWSAPEHERMGMPYNSHGYPGAATYIPPEYAQDSITFGALSSQDHSTYAAATPADWVLQNLARYGINLKGDH